MRPRASAAVGVLCAALVAAGCATGTLAPSNTPVRPAAAATASTATIPRVASPLAAPTPRHACAQPYPAPPATTASVFCADPATMQAARVVRVVDGDTMHVAIAGKEEVVRFYGINATEVGRPCSAEATARTRQLAGSEVRLLPDARNRDRYGRLLRYVYTPQGLSIDAELVDEGLAYAWRADGALRGAIIAVEEAAHLRRAGCLWR
ncbi:MAG: thermonuclease family protein [Chloroflexota bacterium]|nr:thermonuclease family protein [Chloroflexota bacterium]